MPKENEILMSWWTLRKSRGNQHLFTTTLPNENPFLYFSIDESGKGTENAEIGQKVFPVPLINLDLNLGEMCNHLIHSTIMAAKVGSI